jgi:hypothetical protein
VLDPPELRPDESGITINRVGHPITLPLASLANTTFVGSNGELILYGTQKGLYASLVTAEDWGNPPVQMNQAPAYIFERDISSIKDPEFREELEGVTRMTLDSPSGKKLSIMTIGKITVYIAFTPKQSVIMLTSPDKPDFFSQLMLDNFSWEEIENEILKGIRGR